MIVRRRQESDLVTVAEVIVAKPLEGAVCRLNLNQAFHLGVVEPPVTGLVSVAGR